MKNLIKTDPIEARQRINDLQSGLAEATAIFPGAEQYRACFLGDSWFIVREVSPDEDFEGLWKTFCGHMYALTSISEDMERRIGNPGIRAVASFGDLLQIELPDKWRHKFIEKDTMNWYVLTGADAALVKSEDAQRSGSQSGFLKNMFWFETLERPDNYAGVSFGHISLRESLNPALYPSFFERMRTKSTHDAVLKLPTAESPDRAI